MQWYKYTYELHEVLRCTLTHQFPYNIVVTVHFNSNLCKIIQYSSIVYYTERLQRLNLPSLLYRRSRMDLIMTYKFINGLADMDMNYFFTVNANHTRSNGLKLYKSRFNSNTRKFSFLQKNYQ